MLVFILIINTEFAVGQHYDAGLPAGTPCD